MQSQHLSIDKRISGFRINAVDGSDYAEKFQRKVAALAQFDEVLRLAMGEPFCFDDAYRHLSPEALWRRFLQGGEVVFGMDGQNYGALHILSGIVPGRFAELHSITFPNYRGTGATQQWLRMLIRYATNPLHEKDGLGLKKIKATISIQNSRALKVAAAIGGVHAGTLKGEGLFLGEPTDMVIFEFSGAQPNALLTSATQMPDDEFETMDSSSWQDAPQPEASRGGRQVVGIFETAPISNFRGAPPPALTRVHSRHDQPQQNFQPVRRDGVGQVKFAQPEGQYQRKSRDEMRPFMEATQYRTEINSSGGYGGSPEPRTGENYGSLDELLSVKHYQRQGFDVEVT